MEHKYPHLFSPLKIKDVVFKNRIFSAPGGGMAMQACDTYPNDYIMAHYLEKMQGGVACINFSSIQLDRFKPWEDFTEKYDIGSEIGRKHYIRLTEAAHYYDCKMCLQLQFMGQSRYRPGNCEGVPIYGPSHFVRPDGLVIQEMPEDEILAVADRFADAAAYAKLTGFDMVMIHGAHGMLLAQFLSPHFNKRTDKWGGSLENRARFPLLVLKKIRERVGDDLLIEYRVSGAETLINCPPGGLTAEDCAGFLNMAEGLIDLAHVSVGSTDYSAVGLRSLAHPSGFVPDAPYVHLPADVKALGVPMPVIAVGGIETPDVAEAVLASGKADAIATVRGLLADPQMPEKAQSGRADDITPCIKCYYCLDGYKHQYRSFCSSNPRMGREVDLPKLQRLSNTPQHVVVIGGGPAGMQAALAAADNGHKVTLLEKADRLGGALVFAEKADFKKGLAGLKNVLARRCERSDAIDVRLNTEATPELVSALAPDAVFAAIGGVQRKLNIPGGERAVAAPDVYDAPESLGKNVVVIGGGLVGCETAIFLQRTGRNVTVLEMAGSWASDAMFTYRDALAKAMEDFPVTTNACCTAITAGGVEWIDAEGSVHFTPADSVVAAIGSVALLDEAETYRVCAPRRFRAIGDCRRIANVMQATGDGFTAGSSI